METLQVVAAVLKDEQGRVLINQRPSGKPWAGYWEFPGGKIEAGESPWAALARELREELGLAVHEARPWLQLHHDYPGRRVHLDVWRVSRFSGVAQSHEGQTLAWLRPDELGTRELLPADAPIVKALRLPPRMLVTPSPGPDRVQFLKQLGKLLQRGLEFVQLRAPEMAPAAYLPLAREGIELCHRLGARVVLNSDPEVARELDADGVHLSTKRLLRIGQRPLPQRFLSGASCHDEAEIQQAVAAGLDYIVLGPVSATPSHPQAKALGWEGFRRLAALSTLPVYAIGGLSEAQLDRVRQLGGHGVAGIRSFWHA